MAINIENVEGIVECTHNESLKYNLHEWSSFFCDEENSQAMRSALMASHSYIEEHQVKTLVIDLSQTEDAFNEDDATWINEYAIPKEKELGILYHITVVPENVIANFIMEDWQEKTEGLMTFINVKSLTEAEDWIRSKEAVI